MYIALRLAICLLLLTPLACKKTTPTASPVSKSPTPSSSVTATKNGLDLIDASTLASPVAQITVGEVCGASTFNIHISTYDPNTEYFEFKFCNPNNPTQCQPGPGVDTSFANVDVQLPNLLTSTSTPLVELRSCVRSYDATNPSNNCSNSWQSISPVPAVITDSIVSPLLWEEFVDQTKLTEQCLAIRTALQNFQNATQGQTVNTNLAQLVADGITIGIDNCATAIANGQLEAIETELQNEMGTGTATSTAIASTSSTQIAATALASNTDTSKSGEEKLRTELGTGIGFGLGFGIIALGGAVALKYFLDYQKLDRQIKSLTSAQALNKPTDSVEKIKPPYDVSLEPYLNLEYKGAVNLLEKERAEFMAPDYATAKFAPYQLEFDKSTIEITDDKIVTLGWTRQELIKAGCQPTVFLNRGTSPSPSGLRMDSKLQLPPPKSLLEKDEKIAAMLDDPKVFLENKQKYNQFKRQSLSISEATENPDKASEDALNKQKTAAKIKSGVAAFAAPAIGVLVGVLAGVGIGGGFGLVASSTPQQDLFNTLSTIRTQISAILNDRNYVLAQIAACTVP